MFVIADEPNGRYNMRVSLWQLQKKLEADTATQLFDLQQLKRLNIHVQGLSLDDRGSAQSPRFFTPYLTAPFPNDDCLAKIEEDLGHPDESELSSHHNFSREFCRIWSDYMGRQIEETLIPEETSRWSMNVSAKLFHTLRFRGTPTSPNWERGCNSVLIEKCNDQASPHMKAAIIINDNEGDSHFYRGEILTVLYLIVWQMRELLLIPHIKIPVLVLSIIGSRGRLIEAFYENGKLVLRATQLYDLTKDTAVHFQRFADWWCSLPTGETLDRTWKR